MRKSGTDKLNQERIRQLLAAVGMKAQTDVPPDADVVDYDWRQPRYFNLAQSEKVRFFGDTIARECVEEFSRLYQTDGEVTCISAEQCLSEPDQDQQERGYYVPFGSNPQAAFGMLFVPNPSALVWTGQVLGASESTENSDRKLSKLEESFLGDIAAGLMGAFSRAYGKDLAAGPLVSDRSRIDLKGSQELFKITFEAAKINSEATVAGGAFYICCDKLDSIAGKTASVQTKVPDAQITDTILKHVHQIPVSVSVELGSVTIPFEEVLGLQANDIIVLDKKITDPIDILVEDRPLFQGRPVQSGGNYAVVIL